MCGASHTCGREARVSDPLCWGQACPPGMTRGSPDMVAWPYQSSYPYFAKWGHRDIERPLDWSKVTQLANFRSGLKLEVSDSEPLLWGFDLTSVILECQVWAPRLPEPLCDLGQHAAPLWASDSLSEELHCVASTGWSLRPSQPPGARSPAPLLRRMQVLFSPCLPRPAVNRVIMSSIRAFCGFLKIVCQAPTDARKWQVALRGH